MISLLNKFTLIGTLKECKIVFFKSHIKAKFNIEIDNKKEITVYYFINKKFHQEKYKDFLSIIPKLHPTINGYVWNEKIKYCSVFSKNLQENLEEKLFISGNILEKNENIYFNAEYIKMSKLKNDFSFSLEGIVVDNNHILNIVNDSPRIFNITTNLKSSEKIYNFSLDLNFGYIIVDNYVYNNQQIENFTLLNKKYTDKKINKSDINNYLLEWDIITNNGE